ncbi:DUF308 domain-containing protein [Streptomyces sp. NPDC002742]|uniref:DUF308 domain-containing protein n=1 Tax=Streptomyces sp. NPDC002742 TaxID=3364663 RepID=UPI00369D2BBD
MGATGVMEIVLAFERGEKPGERALFVLTGLVSVVPAFVLFARPDIGAVSPATVFGLFSIFYGTTGIVASFQGRRVRKDIGGAQPTHT